MTLLALIPRWALLAVIAGLLGLNALLAAQVYAARGELVKAQNELRVSQGKVHDLDMVLERIKTDADERTAALQTKLTEAQNAARKREQDNRAAADSARAESDSLRNDIDALRAQLADVSAEAAAQRAIAIGAVFGKCTARYTELAARCDRHVNDIRTLTEGWPK